MESIIEKVMENIITILRNYDGIIGTILGMFFSFFLQSRGKLKIYIKKSYGEFYYNDNVGWRSTIRKASSELDYFIYNVELYLYNNSSDFKSIRDLKLNVFSDEKNILTGRLKDKNTTTYNDGFAHTEEADAYNIPPKNVQILDLSYYISKDDLKKINYNNTFFELEYTDCKNKTKKLKVFKEKLEEPKID